MASKEKANKKETNKNKKSFIKDFKAELKKVVWPTPKQLVNNTVAVVTIVLLTAVIVFVLDVIFEKMNTMGIDKIKEVISTENTTSENETATEGESTDEATTEGEQTDESTGEVEQTDETSAEGESTAETTSDSEPASETTSETTAE